MMKKPNQAKPKNSKRTEFTLTEAQRAEISSLFEDIYIVNKWRIARMNFLRGIFFGLGTFLGGTIVVTIVVWILSHTVDLFPWAERLIDSLKR